MRALAVLVFLSLALAQNSMIVPLTSVAELGKYLERNTHDIWVVGDFPLKGLEGALKGKRIRLITGSAQVQSLPWLRSIPTEVRILPGKVTSAILLADSHYFLVSEPRKFTLLDSDEVVAVLQQRIHLNELWAQARPWRP